MSLLITGGAGYIGSHSTRLLAGRDEIIVVLDNLVLGHRAAIVSDGVTLVPGDTGDAALMEKARGRLEDMVRGAEIFVVATHQTDVLREWTTRAIWLDQGRLREVGTTDATLSAYRQAVPRPIAG